jgi:hypothetical protein
MYAAFEVAIAGKERHDLDVRERAADPVEEFEALGVLPPLGSTAARPPLTSA